MPLQDMASLPGSQTPLRRHGDEFERLPNGYYRALGRCDDTMNLGGIKVGTQVFCLSPFHSAACLWKPGSCANSRARAGLPGSDGF